MKKDIFISKGNIALRLLRNQEKDMKLLLEWLSNPSVVRWAYEEGAPWTMEKIIEQFAEKTQEGGSSTPCIIMYNDEEIGYIQYYPITKDSYAYESADAILKTKDGYGLDMFIGRPELWNKGLGSHTIALIETYLKAEKQVKILCVDPMTDNPRALHFWSKVGFKPLEEIKAWDDDTKKSLLMMKELD